MTKLVKARRHNDQLLQKLSALEGRLHELQTNQTMNGSSAEIVELGEQILAVRQAAIDLFPKLLPSASSRGKPQEKVPAVVVPSTLRVGP